MRVAALITFAVSASLAALPLPAHADAADAGDVRLGSLLSLPVTCDQLFDLHTHLVVGFHESNSVVTGHEAAFNRLSGVQTLHTFNRANWVIFTTNGFPVVAINLADRKERRIARSVKVEDETYTAERESKYEYVGIDGEKSKAVRRVVPLGVEKLKPTGASDNKTCETPVAYIDEQVFAGDGGLKERWETVFYPKLNLSFILRRTEKGIPEASKYTITRVAAYVPPPQAKIEQPAEMKALLNQLVNYINDGKLTYEKVAPILAECVSDVKRKRKEDDAMGCAVMLVIVGEWMSRRHDTLGVAVPAAVSEKGVDATIDEIFDALGFDVATRNMKRAQWKAVAREYIVQVRSP
jgi:hypothetical protein